MINIIARISPIGQKMEEADLGDAMVVIDFINEFTSSDEQMQDGLIEDFISGTRNDGSMGAMSDQMISSLIEFFEDAESVNRLKKGGLSAKLTTNVHGGYPAFIVLEGIYG